MEVGEGVNSRSGGSRLDEATEVKGGGSEGGSGLVRALQCRRWCGKAATKSVEVGS